MVQPIYLTRGQIAWVDDCDYARISAHKWTAKPADQVAEKWYAFRTISQNRRKATVYLHREVMNAPQGSLVDHLDGDGLNCQRANLRLATHAQNVVNRRYSSASGYRGVHRRDQQFIAQIQVDGKIIRVRGGLDAEQAARAYDALASEFYGEFAVLNFPTRKVA